MVFYVVFVHFKCMWELIECGFSSLSIENLIHSYCFVVFVCVLRDSKTSAGDGDARCPSIGESNSNNSGICSPCLCLAFIDQTPKSSIFFPQYWKPYWSFCCGLCAWSHGLPCESFTSGVESSLPLAGLPYVAKCTHKIYSK